MDDASTMPSFVVMYDSPIPPPGSTRHPPNASPFRFVQLGLQRPQLLEVPAHGVEVRLRRRPPAAESDRGAFSRLDPASLAAWIMESGLPLRLQLQLHRLVWPREPEGTPLRLPK